MTEPGAVLEAVHTAIADLAAVLVAVRAGTPSRRPAWKSILPGRRLPASG